MADPPTPDPPPWLDAHEQEAWRAYIVGTRQLLQQLDRDHKAAGVTPDDYSVLVALSESPDDRLRMSELAGVAVESRSRLTHHIGRLEAKGLVRREACEVDKRGLNAVLTPKGRRLIESAAPHHVTAVRSWFLDALEPDELDVIGRAFARIGARLDAATEPCAAEGDRCP
jgi:DNA-binding MarR family transcriptional regulator